MKKNYVLSFCYDLSLTTIAPSVSGGLGSSDCGDERVRDGDNRLMARELEVELKRYENDSSSAGVDCCWGGDMLWLMEVARGEEDEDVGERWEIGVFTRGEVGEDMLGGVQEDGTWFREGREHTRCREGGEEVAKKS